MTYTTMAFLSGCAAWVLVAALCGARFAKGPTTMETRR